MWSRNSFSLQHCGIQETFKLFISTDTSSASDTVLFCICLSKIRRVPLPLQTFPRKRYKLVLQRWFGKMTGRGTLSIIHQMQKDGAIFTENACEAIVAQPAQGGSTPDGELKPKVV